MTDALFLYVTAPDEAAAANIARALVAERLAACVNIHKPVRSIYRWADEIEESEEFVLIVKTASAKAQAARERIAALHPYDTPCIAALPIDAQYSLPAFLEWIGACTKS